jgi:formate dehydrogenase beta subunit
VQFSRRDFIKRFGASTGIILVYNLINASGVAAKSTRSASDTDEKAMLVDVSKCIGCWWCYAACKNYNNLKETVRPSPEDPPKLTADCWTTLFPVEKHDGWSFRKQACMHCTEAACVEVCSTGALSYDPLGFVAYDSQKCIGCGYCSEHCPFDVPRLDGNSITGMQKMAKCNFCQERVSAGLQPACVEACPSGALTFGNRVELIAEGKHRVNELKEEYPKATLYGEKDLEGLHVLYVLTDSPEVYGLPEDPQFPLAAMINNDILGPIARIAWPLVAAGLALNVLVAWFRQRKHGEVH